MANSPRIRVSFIADANYLTRLAQAIERDPTRDDEWRKKVIDLLNQTTRLLLEAAPQKF